MTHDSSKDSNVGVVMSYLEGLEEGYSFITMKKSDTNGVKQGGKLLGILEFFIIKPYHMATSGYIIQDNIFLPMAFLHFKRKVKVIQLWHGTGTIKKFGQSVNVGQLGKLEHRANQTITHLIVNSEATKDIYAEAFSIPPEKVYVLGSPRTDILFQKDKLKQKVEGFYKEYPFAKNKKLLLYVPTFRDEEVGHPTMNLDVDKMLDELEDDYIIGLKLHPFVANEYKFNDKEENKRDKVINLSMYQDLDTLLMAADILITDYSSVIFDYCLLEKPMIFYAYDLDTFSHGGRGFYEDYKTYVPGKIAVNMEELIHILKENSYDMERIHQFKLLNYDYLDGLSTQRLVNNLFIHKNVDNR